MKIILINIIISLFVFPVNTKADETTAREFTFFGFAQFGAAYAAYSFCSFTSAVYFIDEALTLLIQTATSKGAYVEFEENSFSYGLFYYIIFDTYKDSSYSIMLQIPRTEKERVCETIGSGMPEDLQRLNDVYSRMLEYVENYDRIEELETA